MRKIFKKKEGFTLIELLVVIAIIVMLAGIAMVSLTSARQKARDAKRMADLRQFASALELYATDKGEYVAKPTQDGLPPIEGYLVVPMDDPLAPTRHYKWLDNTGCHQSYCAYAVLEDKQTCTTERWFIASQAGTKIICRPDTVPTDGCHCDKL